MPDYVLFFFVIGLFCLFLHAITRHAAENEAVPHDAPHEDVPEVDPDIYNRALAYLLIEAEMRALELLPWKEEEAS